MEKTPARIVAAWSSSTHETEREEGSFAFNFGTVTVVTVLGSFFLFARRFMEQEKVYANPPALTTSNEELETRACAKYGSAAGRIRKG